MTMYEFFKDELINMETNTGQKQYDMLCSKLNWETRLDELIKSLVQEVDSFTNIHEDELKQKILHTAMLENEFYGFSVKWVRTSLLAWWKVHRDAYTELKNRKEEKIEPDLPHEEKVRLMETYLPQVLQNIAQVETKYTATVKELNRYPARELGRTESTGYQPISQQPDHIVKVKERIRKICADTYKHLDPYRMPKGFDSYRIEDFEIYCESFEKAKEIYEQAKEI